MASGGKEFNPGSETSLGHSGLLCNYPVRDFRPGCHQFSGREGMSPGSCQVKPCNCLLVGPRRERHLEMILGTTFVRGEEWTAGQREPLNRCDSVTSQPNPQGALPRGDTSELLESRQGLGLHSCLKQTLDVGFPRGRWELAQSPSLSSSVLMEGQRGTPPCPLHVLWVPLGWPWEAQSSPRVARESWGWRSSHCRAEETSPKRVSGT